MFILFSYQCSFRLLISYLHQQLCYTIICRKSCQQLFSTFFDSFSLFQRRPLKLVVFCWLLLPCSATLDNIHPGTNKSQQYFLIFFQNGTLTDFTFFICCFCAFCTIFLFCFFDTAFCRFPYSQETHCYLRFMGISW